MSALLRLSKEILQPNPYGQIFVSNDHLRFMHVTNIGNYPIRSKDGRDVSNLQFYPIPGAEHIHASVPADHSVYLRVVDHEEETDRIHEVRGLLSGGMFGRHALQEAGISFLGDRFKILSWEIEREKNPPESMLKW